MLLGDGSNVDGRTAFAPYHECNALQGTIFFGRGSVSR